MLAAILPPLLPPRRSMLLVSQASPTAALVDGWMSAPQETTEGPMPEGRRTSVEDSAGPTVVTPRTVPIDAWLIPLVDGGGLPPVYGPCENHVEPFPHEWGPMAQRDRAERILLGSLRIFRALAR
jgi:hypothetical protein